jgi:amino acid adenylation domain-containing protein
LADHLPASLGAARVVLLDDPGEDGEGDLHGWAVPDEALAYVIYTSGSTGRPKGAMNSHRGIINRLLWMQREYELGPEDVVVQKTPMSFDVSVWEFFWPLLAGARLVLARPGGHRDSRYLAALIAEQGVTTAHFVPSLLGAFLDEPAAAGCFSLRRVIASGEALSRELVRRFEASGLRAGLHNLYGPTEAAVDVTFWACGPEGSEVPIGRPVANTQVHVLDAGVRPVPLGIAGELFLGGVQVGRGYLGKPELTAERFVPDPCSAEPGARLYRTGDLGRHRADGAVEYLGRLDHQVKIRGVRIELGEIEAALLREPQVREAAVLAVSDRLIAYVAGPGELPSATELRRELGRWLPEAMMPSAFVVLTALPLTPSGKIDRLALARIEPERETATSPQTPRTPVEDLLAGIFQQVLEVEAVGIHDGFFDLGGHSLLANRVVARVRQTFGVELPLRELFEAPTVVGLAERIAAALRAEGEPAPPLIAESLDGPLPLSYAQERLWFLDRLEPGSAAYNMPAAFRLEGPLVEEALERAFAEIVRRHAVLRTRFVEIEGRPAQVIDPTPAFGLWRADLHALPVERRERELVRLAREEAARPFDLVRGTLMRAGLVGLDEREHALLVSMHHIASDGWSIGVLVHEVTALYRAFSTGAASPLTELPVQYADYARWQRGWLQGEVLQRQLTWWRQRLEGAPPLLDLPLDRPRQTGGGRPAGVERAALPGELVLALRDFGRRRGATLFMVLLAGFQALLSRLSGQEDVVIGSPVANRNRRETEDLIGFFVNTLALRANLAGAPGFASLLDRARESALGAYAHQDLPFERLVEELRPERSRAHSPLFQVVLALQNAPLGERELPGLHLAPLEVPPGTAKFDLTLVLAEEGEGLSAWLEHDRRILDGASVRRLFGHFEALLAGAAADPACPLSELPLLGSAERHQLVAEWSAAPAARHTGKGLAELFADQATRSPGAIALEIETEKGMERLTYGELNRRANRLAWHLRSLGVGSATRVGIGMQRSADLVVALLGVLKAGGAYVPLNPGDPEERLTLFLADARVPLVLVREESRERIRQAVLRSPAAVRVLCLDEEAQALAERSADDPAPIAGACHPAYAIYTSGSTGLPKGVLVSQEAVARLVLDTDYVELRPTQRMAHVSNPAFDAATFEIWGALLHGACLVGLPRDAALTPVALARQLRELRIDVMFLTTALFNQVAGQVPDAFATLDTLLFGGEAVDPASVRRVLECGAPRRLLHVYGPTECTTFSAWQQVREVLPAAATVPIGRPVADTALHVVDLSFRPVPVGVVGELLVGGSRLALGYLERPDLTAERFVPDPWGGEVGRRLYRTGDLVRWSPRGAIEFVGRRDHQVKIRGFRIEPGEVEAALASHPGVREAVVVVDEAGAGGRRLVAYVVAAPGLDGEPIPRELRGFVAAKLPAYMIPALFIPMPSLPLNANGKVDRRALPPPERVRPELASAFLAPRTSLERDLAGIWTAALGCGEVGIHDNFFELGGHSLLATHLLARYQESLGMTLPLSLLFESPTISGLAEAIETARRLMAEAQEARKSPENPPAIRRIARESHRIKLS